MTKNKIVILLIFLALAAGGIYLYFMKGKGMVEKITEYEVQSSSVKPSPYGNLPRSSGKLPVNEERLKEMKRDSFDEQNVEAVDNEDNKKDFEAFDKFEARWISEVKKVFPKPKMFDVYLVFREDNEKEKMEVYEEFHKLMEKKFGPNYTYSLSEDQTKMEQKINDKYLKKLKDMMGEKAFMEYLKVRDEFNEQIMRETKGQRPLLIEY